MKTGYAVYGVNDVYLMETELLYYGWKSGEIFVKGNPLSKFVNKIGLSDYAKLLLGDYSRKYLENLYGDEPYFEDKRLERLAIINSYNGYSKIHFLYIVLRVNGFGLCRTISQLSEFGVKYLNGLKTFYKKFLESDAAVNCPNRIETYMGRLPIWMDVVRRIIHSYVMDFYGEHLEEYKDFDRRVRNYIKNFGYVCGDVYTLYLMDLIGNDLYKEILIKPKFLASEALYMELKSKDVNELVIPPLYKGVLLHSPSIDLFKEETQEDHRYSEEYE